VHPALLLAIAMALLLAAALWVRLARDRRVPAPPVRVLDLSRFASPELPLDRGLALVVFMAMDCAHCIEAAQMIGNADLGAQGVSACFIMLGKPEEVGPFFDRIGAWVPYILTTPADYAEFAGEDPPGIYLLEQGAVRAHWSGSAFNLTVLRDELGRRR